MPAAPQMELFDGSGDLLVSFEGFRNAKNKSTLVEADSSMFTTKWIESSHLDSVAMEKAVGERYEHPTLHPDNEVEESRVS